MHSPHRLDNNIYLICVIFGGPCYVFLCSALQVYGIRFLDPFLFGSYWAYSYSLTYITPRIIPSFFPQRTVDTVKHVNRFLRRFLREQSGSFCLTTKTTSESDRHRRRLLYTESDRHDLGFLVKDPNRLAFNHKR